MSNKGVADWSDILSAVTVRIEENETRMNECRDPEVMIILVRIQKDDLQRQRDAARWIDYHRN